MLRSLQISNKLTFKKSAILLLGLTLVVALSFATKSLAAPVATDTTPPQVALTSPANDSQVKGLVNLQATASDNVGVNRVEFSVNDQVVGVDFTAPYSYDWKTPTLSDIPPTYQILSLSTKITVQAFDNADNKSLATATVNVVPPTAPTPPDTSAPFIEVFRANGNTLTPTTTPPTMSGELQFVASMRDFYSNSGYGLWRVNFLVDGVVTQTCLQDLCSGDNLDGSDGANVEIWVDSKTLANGIHTFSTEAYDRYNNKSKRASILVEVDNGVSAGPRTGGTKTAPKSTPIRY